MLTDFNPTTMATQLATAYTQGLQTQLTTQTKKTDAVAAALTKLQSALRTFNTAASGLSGTGKSVMQYAASFSTADIGTATASSTAQPGTHSFYVERLATAHQIAYDNLPTVPVAQGGVLGVQLAGGTSFNVNFATADLDADGNLTPAETARAINQAADNKGQVSAMVVTVGATTQLVLSSTATGAANQITLDTSAMPAGALKTTLAAVPNTLVAAQDAIVWLGAKDTGVKIQQASNTYTSVQGVTMTFKRAMAVGEAPVQLTVTADKTATADKLRGFVDAYNTLQKTLDELTKSADAEKGTEAAVFASDSGVRALRNKLNDLIRQDFGGARLLDFGIKSDRNGALSLDTAKLDKTLAAGTLSLDTLFGSASLTARSGLLGALDTHLDLWTDTTSGQIKRRQDSVQTQQKAARQRQAQLDDQYQRSYDRYLLQFSQLQTLMSQMSQTSGLFTSAG
ncbi:flagellar filament capping protein FliD [Caldimonas brevitalea]|uniref:Flagellar hook-associated protein 2 n=1 Tax=Caldimonas brevitalea TaxID=413882 RepID=A0A0G3BV22_9BURK|nr:flagellar filament capping protein FliD [Caldimonas brevitalea]AKJ30365.1 lateral flagellar hook-associated protein 2 [Caldimonas brevitalea]